VASNVPSIEASIAKIGASGWTVQSYPCRREREILAQLVEQYTNENPGVPCGCGTPLVSAARDRFIKTILAEELSKRERESKNSAPSMLEWYGMKRETHALYVEFLRRSLDESIHEAHPAYLVYQDYMNTKFQEMEHAQAELNRLTERLEGMKRVEQDGFIVSRDMINELERKAEFQRQILSWL
jgi:hypothetical protein